jgi:hypothetical protein
MGDFSVVAGLLAGELFTEDNISCDRASCCLLAESLIAFCADAIRA